MELTPQKRRALSTALLSAFRSYEDLRLFTDHRLGHRLGDFSSSEQGLQSVVLDLLEKSNAEGWLHRLVRQARRELPGNPALAAYEGKYLEPFSLEQLLELERCAQPLGVSRERLLVLARYSGLPEWMPPDATGSADDLPREDEEVLSRVIEDLASSPVRSSGPPPLHEFVRLLIAEKRAMREPTGPLRRWLQATQGGLALTSQG